MIRRDNQYDSEVREKMRDGRGEVKIEHLWKKDELCNRARLLARLTLTPGSSIGFHEHIGECEVFYILQGQAKMLDNNRQETLTAGDTILTSDCGHAVEAAGNENLIMLAVILPAST